MLIRFWFSWGKTIKDILGHLDKFEYGLVVDYIVEFLLIFIGVLMILWLSRRLFCVYKMCLLGLFLTHLDSGYF